MSHKALKYLISMVTAAGLGFVVVHLSMSDFLNRSITETKLELNIQIRGNNNIPVANAQLSFLTPQEKPIGVSNSYGNFDTIITVPSGKVTTIQATGPSFRILKDIFVPHVSHLKMQVFLDPAEAKLGHMSLMTRNLEHFNKQIQKKLQKSAAVLRPKPPEPARVVVEFLPAAHSFSGNLVKEHRDALLKNVALNELKLVAAQFKRITVRVASEEGPYLELIALDEQNRAAASTLMKMSEKRDFPFEIGIKRLLRPPPRDAKISFGRLIVKTSSPEKTRAYLNGIALPRKIRKTYVVFDFSGWQHINPDKKIFLSVTSDKGPFVRTQMNSAQLKRKIRWILPENQLSRR